MDVAICLVWYLFHCHTHIYLVHLPDLAQAKDSQARVPLNLNHICIKVSFHVQSLRQLLSENLMSKLMSRTQDIMHFHAVVLIIVDGNHPCYALVPCKAA